MRLPAELVGRVDGSADAERRSVVVTDLSLAGAGLETTEPLLPGERLTLSLVVPSMWDALVIESVVAWADSPQLSPHGDDAVGRAGLVFDHRTASTALALFKVFSTVG